MEIIQESVELSSNPEFSYDAEFQLSVIAMPRTSLAHANKLSEGSQKEESN